MLSEFTKIIDRNFIIGYLLPVVLFISTTILLIQLFFPDMDVYTYAFMGQSQNNTVTASSSTALVSLLQNFWAISLASLIAIFISIVLVVINRVLIRIMEGYHLFRYTPLQQRQLKKFIILKDDLNKIRRDREEELRRIGRISPESEKKYETDYMKTILKLKEQFPPKEDQVLPTSFGNVVRAFELYPQVLYGLDSIPVWARISSLIPKDSTEGLNGAKAQVDFAINSLYLTFLILLEYAAFASFNRNFQKIWIPIAALILMFIWYQFAISAAIEWGDQVKAIFDLYRNSLLSQMGLRIPEKWEDERVIWQKISKSFLYWDELDVERDPKNPKKES